MRELKEGMSMKETTELLNQSLRDIDKLKEQIKVIQFYYGIPLITIFIYLVFFL